jgi:hypothetical protein
LGLVKRRPPCAACLSCGAHRRFVYRATSGERLYAGPERFAFPELASLETGFFELSQVEIALLEPLLLEAVPAASGAVSQ